MSNLKRRVTVLEKMAEIKELAVVNIELRNIFDAALKDTCVALLALADATEQARAKIAAKGGMMTMLLADFEKEFAKALAIGEDTVFPMIGTVVTFPAYMKREDFERMKVKIQAMIRQAERRGEQRALASIWGVGPKGGIKSRFLELLEQHPELTRPQAYIQAVMETSDLVIEETVKRMGDNDDSKEG